MSFLLLLNLLFFIGCTSIDQQLKDDVFYEHAMNMRFNGIDYHGYGVVHPAKKYQIRVWGRGKMDFLRITTCHREITKNKEGSRAEFEYIPIPEMEMIEDGPNFCPMYFESYEEGKGRNDWGIVDFLTPFEKLKATNYCNGKITTETVTVCHSRQGLKQKLVFEEPAELSKQVKQECKIDSMDGGKTWLYSMTKKVCPLLFRDIKTKSKYHRHTNVGYEDVLIPAGEH